MADNQPDERADNRPRTIAALLERLSYERRPLEDAANAIDDAHLADDARGWSIKDHLAHVAAWERRLLGEMRGDHDAERFGVDEAASATADTDTINAMIYARYRDAPPDDVRAELIASGEALRSTITAMTDADLGTPARPDDPLVETLVDLISWDTYRHYPVHARAVVDRETWPKPNG